MARRYRGVVTIVGWVLVLLVGFLGNHLPGDSEFHHLMLGMGIGMLSTTCGYATLLIISTKGRVLREKN